MLRVGLLKNFVNLLLRNLSALAVKHLGEALLGDKPRVIHVEVMKGKHQILHGQSLLLVDCRRQELTIVDGAWVVEVYRLKDILKVNWRDIRILKGLLHLVQIQEATVVFVKGPESLSQWLEIYHVLG